MFCCMLSKQHLIILSNQTAKKHFQTFASLEKKIHLSFKIFLQASAASLTLRISNLLCYNQSENCFGENETGTEASVSAHPVPATQSTWCCTIAWWNNRIKGKWILSDILEVLYDFSHLHPKLSSTKPIWDPLVSDSIDLLFQK